MYEPRHVIPNSVAFWHEWTQAGLCSLLLSLENPSGARLVARRSWGVQATSKCSDQTAHMRRLVWAFVGRTYHIVGSLMSRLIYANTCSEWIKYFVFFKKKHFSRIYRSLPNRDYSRKGEFHPIWNLHRVLPTHRI